MIARTTHRRAVERLLRQLPCVAVLGVRQVGKSTLARQVADGAASDARIFDLEHPRDLRKLTAPLEALEDLRGLVVLDEVQHRPDLFPVLRVLADRPRTPARFLILGSASPGMLRQSAESLAGRIAYHELGGFDLQEVGAQHWRTLWLRGGFPRSFTARGAQASLDWRHDFVRTHLERELPDLGVRIPAATMRRYWMMLSHYHGQVWNAAELARAFGVAERTVRHYLDILAGTFLVTRLDPWFENVGKRQVKAPKVYLSDSGILHAMLGIDSRDALLGHPKVGASFEGFAVQHVIRRLDARGAECFFWGVHGGPELDLLIVRGNERRGFEVKFTDAPEVTRSLLSARETLGLDAVDILYPGPETFSLGDGFRAVSIARLWQDVDELGR